MEDLASFDTRRQAQALHQGIPQSGADKKLYHTTKAGKTEFRLRARYMLLTYSQIPEFFNWGEVKDEIKALGGECVICLEEHRLTGGQHIHVFASHEERFQFRRPNTLDVQGIHPNIKPITATPNKAWEYVRKEGRILYDGIPDPPKVRNLKRKGEDINEVYRHVLEGDSRNEKLKRLKEARPSDYFRSFNNVFKCIEYENPRERDIEQYENPEGFWTNTSAYPEIEEWCREYLPNTDYTRFNADRTGTGDTTSSAEPSSSGESIFSMACGGTKPDNYSGSDFTSCYSGEESYAINDKLVQGEGEGPRYDQTLNQTGRRCKCLILWGQSMVGKTIFARSLGRHSYFNNMFVLADYDEGCEYAIFDDISGGMAKISYKQFMGGQDRVGVTDKWCKNRQIKWGRPCIYLCNRDPFIQGNNPGVELEWLKKNSVAVEIKPSVKLADSAYGANNP